MYTQTKMLERVVQNLKAKNTSRAYSWWKKLIEAHRELCHSQYSSADCSTCNKIEKVSKALGEEAFV